MDLKYIIILLFIIFIEIFISYKAEKMYSLPENKHKIHDLGFKIIPKLNNKYNFIDDILIIIPIIALFFYKIDYKKYLLSLIIIQILRSICLMLTILPPPDKNCENNLKKKENNFYFFRMCFGRCNETIFSNHTSILLLTLIYLYPNFSKLIQKFMVVYFLTTIYIILGLRNHYSIDVFLAIIITSLVVNSIDKI